MNLLKQVKQRLNITWSYDDEQIDDMIKEGKVYLIDRVGDLDFEKDISAIRLLKEYCRYSWNGSASSFENDFKSDIINLQLKNAIQQK